MPFARFAAFRIRYLPLVQSGCPAASAASSFSTRCLSIGQPPRFRPRPLPRLFRPGDCARARSHCSALPGGASTGAFALPGLDSPTLPGGGWGDIKGFSY